MYFVNPGLRLALISAFSLLLLASCGGTKRQSAADYGYVSGSAKQAPRVKYQRRSRRAAAPVVELGNRRHARKQPAYANARSRTAPRMDSTLNSLRQYSQRLDGRKNSSAYSRPAPAQKRQYSQKYKGFVYPFPEKKSVVPAGRDRATRGQVAHGNQASGSQHYREAPDQTLPQRRASTTPDVAMLSARRPRPAPDSENSYNFNTDSDIGLSRRKIKKALYRQFQEWRGVRYRIGGMSRRGIDCSRFVHLTFRDQFGLQLPKNTRDQAAVGKRIARFRLRSGDLVFFRTGFRTRHVGIYIKKGQFLHASTSRGVVISNMKKRYWRRRYWKSIRILR